MLFHCAGSSPSALVSPKEERDLSALLEVFAMGLRDVENFEQRLQAEHGALEVSSAGEAQLSIPVLTEMHY